MRALASSRSFFWPPDSLPPYSSFSGSREKRSNRSSAWAVFDRSCVTIVERLKNVFPTRSPVWFGAASSMFSNTVILLRIRVSWKVRTSPLCAIECAGLSVMSTPSKQICPLSGSRKPVTMSKKVVFPAPFGPISAVMLSRSISRSSTSTAITPPKCFRTWVHERMVSLDFKRQLLLPPEQALRPEDHQHHDQSAHEDEPCRRDCRGRHAREEVLCE